MLSCLSKFEPRLRSYRPASSALACLEEEKCELCAAPSTSSVVRVPRDTFSAPPDTRRCTVWVTNIFLTVKRCANNNCNVRNSRFSPTLTCAMFCFVIFSMLVHVQSTMTDGCWSIRQRVVRKDKLGTEEGRSLQALSRHPFVSRSSITHFFGSDSLSASTNVCKQFTVALRSLSNKDCLDFYVTSKGITIGANTCILRCRCPRFYYEVIQHHDVGSLPTHLLERISDFIK